MQNLIDNIIYELNEKKSKHTTMGLEYVDSEIFLLEREEYGKVKGLEEAIDVVKQAAKKTKTRCGYKRLKYKIWMSDCGHWIEEKYFPTMFVAALESYHCPYCGKKIKVVK